jgi:hypothetical protein
MMGTSPEQQSDAYDNANINQIAADSLVFIKHFETHFAAASVWGGHGVFLGKWL